MKTLFSLLAVAGFASAAPVNTECPVAGKPAKPSVTTTHEGKEIAFCCNNCKGKFEADPAKYAKKIK
ncbi:MAG TPA: YHS domain-containing protein [Prosthecobacter sp.]|mgnify:FL=1|jgi:YHS domain-containing protein|nr:YHS domain-containing protein [Prosthecobacter sp.]HRK15686.1 YHS domain-containing protein [Prosthecobacter sp.]